ncbi:MAG: 5'-nucleotidase C-terminal domain-containing protein [Saprospiraceae bacterium]|nr:5'-nucleotidase C-terminal domain-containing protein [Candidatus Vicinibacter affinis]
MNSGSIRVDDVLLDKLSQYDILRSMPYGGSVLSVKMKGSLLKKVLDIGWSSKGRGAFLQWDRIERTETGNWLIQEKVLEVDREYQVAMNEFLMTGLESGLDFLKEGNPEILEVTKPAIENNNDYRRDIRLVVIDYLKKGGR